MKPPSGPKKQTQFKACPGRSEFTLSVIEGNGPISSKAKIACQKIRPHPLNGAPVTHRDLIVPFTRNHLFGIM